MKRNFVYIIFLFDNSLMFYVYKCILEVYTFTYVASRRVYILSSHQ
jgi:hypothetical protein